MAKRRMPRVHGDSPGFAGDDSKKERHAGNPDGIASNEPRSDMQFVHLDDEDDDVALLFLMSISLTTC